MPGQGKNMAKKNLIPQWMKEMKPDDTFMIDPKETDIIIPYVNLILTCEAQISYLVRAEL